MKGATYQPNLCPKLPSEVVSTFVNVTARLTATYAVTSMACPADLNPGTFRTNKFLTILGAVSLDPLHPKSIKEGSVP